MADHITEFFKIFVEPAFEDSTMFKHRLQIRGNQFLNKLLHDNTNGLRHIFERYKVDYQNKPLFTKKSAVDVFGGLKHRDF